MPSTYAHYRLGRQVLLGLNDPEKETIFAKPDLYWIGLHGPDILFYYKALSPNPVSAVGYNLHEASGASFFAHARTVIENCKDKTAALSYIYGVLNHFALDVSCHAYVDEKIASGTATHTEIEVDFDRALMIRDRLNPVSHVLTGHIHPTAENAAVIAPFYPGVSAEQVQKALKSMIFQNKMLLARTPIKRQLIFAVMKLTGNYKELHGLVIRPKGNPACKDSNQCLMSLYDEAVGRAWEFIENFDGYLEHKCPLNPIFSYTFGGKPSDRKENLE